ncbi:MAG: DUF1566 domain-containing protein [Deltaproteobacteria bacterium]|nr:DUF1566 domain-containing protein [Deltaproteobacteria bacterium]MBN2672112.1 DUF1566 domain-containing protein [Deltaproteobacteria bacterium]
MRAFIARLVMIPLFISACSAMMDDVARLGERGTDDTENDALPVSRDSDSDSIFVPGGCDEDMAFGCYQGDVWCLDEDSESVGLAIVCVNGECVDGACDCLTGWLGDSCDRKVSCVGTSDFVFCQTETSTAANGDLDYDICLNETCVSPGSCNSADCNGMGSYFPLASPGEESWRIISQIEDEAAVLDNSTGLYWMKCPMGQTGENCELQIGASTLAWMDAVVQCDQLSYAGYDDWYLPSEFELLSILVFASGDLAKVDEDWFPQTPALDFWTSTTYAPDENYAKRVFFDSGLLRGNHPYAEDGNVGLKVELHPVRCVRRDAISSLANRWERRIEDGSSSHPVVVDNLSARMWMGCPAGQSDSSCTTGGMLAMILGDATSYCENLNWAAYTDWRIPTPNEYFSLIGSSEVMPALGAREYWSIGDQEGGYYVDTGLWLIGGRAASLTHPIFCIRDLI